MLNLSRNWAGNQRFGAQRYHEPETLQEIQQIVASGTHIKATGARHSFSPIADTSGEIISMKRYNRPIDIDTDRMVATASAGMPYGLFCAELHKAGFAVHNMASLPQITLAGACATATHGSGDANGNLATAVTALTLVTADGDLLTLDRENDPDDFRAVVVGLGGFGVTADLTLEIRPAYTVRQDIYDNLPMGAMLGNFDDIMGRGYSVSLFTTWQKEYVEQVWVKRLVDETSEPGIAREIHGARLAEVNRHPSPGKPEKDCTEQLGVSGPWFERLPHFRMEAVGETGEDLQTEYFIDRSYAVEALSAVAGIREQLGPVIKISEIRTVAEDDIWMSPSYESACVGIHWSWQMDLRGVEQLMPVIEESLEPFSPRPHWGKLFTMSPERVASRYPRYAQFRSLMQKYDPHRKFRNQFLDRYFWG